jgi:predicted nucleotidyltransferase
MKPSSVNELEFYFRKEKIFDLLEIDKIGVFGSFARNEVFNDIDLIIEDNVKTEAIIYLSEKLKNDIQTPVDIILSKYAEPIILHQAKQDMKYATRE